MSRSTTMSTTTRDRLARLQQLRADCVALTCEIFEQSWERQEAAYARGDEAEAWAAGQDARRARVALDEIRANLDRWVERLEARETT